MAYTLDTTIGDLLKDPQAKVVMDQYVPGLSTNPLIEMAKPMSLNMVLAMPQAAQFGLTKDKAEALLVEINKRVA